MHWFWITKPAALLLVSAIVVALPLGPYTLPTQYRIHEQLDQDGSTTTDWPLHLSEEPPQAGHHIPSAYNTDLWMGTQDLHQSSTASSSLLWPTVSVPGILKKEIIDPSSKAIPEPSISTYLQSETDQIGLSGGVQPLLFYTSNPPDSSTASESHVLLYPTVTDEHMFSQVSGASSSQFPDTQIVGKQSAVSDSEESVPVVKSTLISEIRGEKQNLSGTEGTTVSINGLPKIFAAEDNNSTVVIPKDIKNTTQSMFNNSEGILSDNSNFSLEPAVHTLNSFSQGMDKPIVNIPRLVTRDLGNNSESTLSTSLQISILASHALDQEEPGHTSSLSTSVPQLKPPVPRAGKSAGYFPSQFHPLVLSTISPSNDGPDAFPFPHSSDTSDIMQSYIQGPKNNDDFLNPKHVEASVKDSDVPKHEKIDSRVIWISRTSSVSGITPEHKKIVSAAKPESINVGSSQLGDIEMADSPYNYPESSTIIGSRPRIAGDSVSKPSPVSSHEFVPPIDKAVDGTDNKPSDVDHLPAGAGEKGQGREMLKVIPPLMASSKVVNTSFQNVRQPDDRTKSSYIPPVDSENIDGNTSVGSVTDDANFSTVTNEAGSLPADAKSGVLAVPTSVPGLKKFRNVSTAAKDVEENKTTVVTILSTILPVSNGRVSAAVPDGSHHGLDAASITGISLGILVFAALVGAVSFILYRRQFLNKPQTLNDKCSNPDSSGYIDDSTLRENSEEMYSLDNDSFLNSLEAMTIQNYWTDNVKHTKL